VGRRLHLRWTLNHFVIVVWSAKEAKSAAVKYWEIIADNLSKAGWSWGASQPWIVAGERPFRFGAILLFPFLFLQSLLGLPPRDDEMLFSP
jgi:hypothetical protein